MIIMIIGSHETTICYRPKPRPAKGKHGAYKNDDIGFIVGITYTLNVSTHWGRVPHIPVGNLTIIGSDNGLSPGRRQAIIWTNAGILLIGHLGTNFCEILIEIQTFSLKKKHV